MNVDVLNQWILLGTIEPNELEFARDTLHHAAQLVGAVGRSLNPKSADDEYAAMEWNTGINGLLGHWNQVGNDLFAVALRFTDLSILIINKEGIKYDYSLKGKTLEEALEWIKSRLKEFTPETDKITLDSPFVDELPEHPVTYDQAFEYRDTNHFKEVARFYNNANLLLRQLANDIDGASAVKCWPHHFDIATLIIITKDDKGKITRSIGIGMQPGDANYYYPYFYVTPYPYPKKDNLQLVELEGNGKWHTQGWFGAVLETSEIIKHKTKQTQIAATLGFLGSALTGASYYVRVKQS